MELYFTKLLVRSLVIPTTVLCSRSKTSNGLRPAAVELRVLNRLLIVPVVEMLIIRVNLCLLVLRPRGSMVLQGVA